MARIDPYDKQLQQRVGKWANITIILVVIFTLSRCFAKTPEEKVTACFVKEMRGQGEHMRDAVLLRCKQKTNYDKRKR